MKRTALAAAAMLVVAAVAAVAGCESESERAAEKQLETAQKQLQCSRDAKPVSLPAPPSVPAVVPLPAGTTVYQVDDRGTGGVVISAVTSTPFQDVLHFMNTDLVGAGFTITKGETEEHDAEADWESASYRGRWAIREVGTQCPGDTLVTILTAAKS